MNKKLLIPKILRISLLLLVASFTKGNAQTTVTVSAAKTWNGYANVFNLDMSYNFGTGWGLPDLKSTINADNSVELYPNFNTYNATDPFWADGAMGNKIFEGNTYVEDLTLAGQTLTFNGHVNSNTLASGYTSIAFIKGLNPNNNYNADVFVSAPLTSGQDFSITANSIPAGLIVQYGFAVTGLNGNPANAAALGKAVVVPFALHVDTIKDQKLGMYPNPAHNVLNITSETTIETIAVYNMFGQKVLSVTPNNTTSTVDVSALANGIYVVNTSGNGASQTSKFVKN